MDPHSLDAVIPLPWVSSSMEGDPSNGKILILEALPLYGFYSNWISIGPSSFFPFPLVSSQLILNDRVFPIPPHHQPFLLCFPYTSLCFSHYSWFAPSLLLICVDFFSSLGGTPNRRVRALEGKVPQESLVGLEPKVGVFHPSCFRPKTMGTFQHVMDEDDSTRQDESDTSKIIWFWAIEMELRIFESYVWAWWHKVKVSLMLISLVIGCQALWWRFEGALIFGINIRCMWAHVLIQLQHSLWKHYLWKPQLKEEKVKIHQPTCTGMLVFSMLNCC